MASNQSIDERRSLICELFERDKEVRVQELSSILNVSEITIRRDLDHLEKENVLKKVSRSMFVLKKEDYEPPYMVRSNKMSEEKKVIGKCAASLIPDNSLVFIDVGSTLLELAKNIPNNKNISVLTHWIPGVMELAKRNFNSIFLLGGKVLQHEMSVVINRPINYLDGFNIEICFIGASGISIEEGLTDYILEEIEIKKELISRSKNKIVLADHTKFNKVSPIKICNLSEINSIITDKNLDQEIIKKYEKTGLNIISAE